MKRIEDKEVKAKFDDVFKARWSDKPMSTEDIAEHFFAAGYEAAIAERAKFDEQAQAPNATAQTFMAFLRFANAIEAEKKTSGEKGDEDRQSGLGSTEG